VRTIVRIPVSNGAQREVYSVAQTSDGSAYILNEMEPSNGGPVDTMHIDPQAFGPLAAVFTALHRATPAQTAEPVVMERPARIAVPGGNVVSITQVRRFGPAFRERPL